MSVKEGWNLKYILLLTYEWMIDMDCLYIQGQLDVFGGLRRKLIFFFFWIQTGKLLEHLKGREI